MESKNDNWIIVAASVVIVLGGAMILYSYRSKIAPAIANVTSKLPASLIAQIAPAHTPTTAANPVFIDLATVLPDRNALQDFIKTLTPVKKSDPSANAPKYEYRYNGYYLTVIGWSVNADGTLQQPMIADVYPKAPAVLGYEINYGNVQQKYSSFKLKNNAPYLQSFTAVNGLPELK